MSGVGIMSTSTLLNLSAVRRRNDVQEIRMAFDVTGYEGTCGNHFQFFRSCKFQGGFGQAATDPLPFIRLWHFGMEKIQPSIGLRVVDFCDLSSDSNFEAMRGFVSVNYIIDH